jgi:hypothetical protein
MMLYDDLLGYISKKNDLSLIKNFDKDLQKFRPVPLAILYTGLVDDYLKEHLGESSNQYISTLFNHLYDIKAKESIDQIKKLIKTEYGHRQGLETPEYI